jgi:hypothetical protein
VELKMNFIPSLYPVMEFNDLTNDSIYYIGKHCDISSLRTMALVSKLLNRIISKYINELYDDHFNGLLSFKTQLCKENVKIGHIPTTLIDKHNEYVSKKLKYIRTEKVYLLGLTAPNRRQGLYIQPDKCINHVIKNIRYKHQHLVESISIELGGGSLDIIDNTHPKNKLFALLRKVMHIDDPDIIPFGCITGDNYLPFKNWQDLRINFKFNGNPHDNYNEDEVGSITYELYEIDTMTNLYQDSNNWSMVYPSADFPSLMFISYFSSTMEHTGVETIFNNLSGRYRYRLWYLRIPSKFIIHVSNVSVTIAEIILEFYVNGNKYIFIPFFEKKDRFYVIDFMREMDINNIGIYGIDLTVTDIIIDFKFANIPNNVTYPIELNIYNLGYHMIRYSAD